MTMSRRLEIAPTLSDQAYRTLREMITSGELSAREPVTERLLAERLGVSPTPVREALRRLEHERLIERPGRRTLRVAAPSHRRLYELSIVEGALRGSAARLAAQAATEAELQAISVVFEASQQSLEGGDPSRAEQALALTRRFHDLIDRAAHSEILVDMIATTTAFDMTARRRAIETLGENYPVEEGQGQHEQILAALVARDGERAEQLMRDHIREAGEFFLIYGDPA
jgi:DNA-binding GntR family transcriptional regulator